MPGLHASEPGRGVHIRLKWVPFANIVPANIGQLMGSGKTGYRSVRCQRFVSFSEIADISITYNEPKSSPFPQTTVYDMVIISPSKFSKVLEPLINHKNSHSVPTFLKTTEDIYADTL